MFNMAGPFVVEIVYVAVAEQLFISLAITVETPEQSEAKEPDD